MDDARTDHNEVRLQGRLSVAPEVKQLPSGATLVLLKVVTTRPEGARADSLPVVVGPPPDKGTRRRAGQATTATVRRAAALAAGDRVRVTGRLQRHFWTADGTRLSRLQVAADDVAKL